MDMSTVKWRKSRHSGDDGGNCVELAALPGTVGIRDSKAPDTPHLVLDQTAFQALITNLKQR